jgi:hypothetical protein
MPLQKGFSLDLEFFDSTLGGKARVDLLNQVKDRLGSIMSQENKRGE